MSLTPEASQPVVAASPANDPKGDRPLRLWPVVLLVVIGFLTRFSPAWLEGGSGWTTSGMSWTTARSNPM